LRRMTNRSLRAFGCVGVAALLACEGPQAEPDGEIETATEAATAEFELRLQAILLLDDDAASNCAASPCTTPADITDFTKLSNKVFAKAGVRFTFDPNWDWTTLVDRDLNENLQSGSDHNWGRANQIASRYPGKIVIFLRKVAYSNFAFPPNTGQRVPGDAGLPRLHPNFIGHNGDRGGALWNRQNFAHELGHFLGLFHTHLTWGNCYPTSRGCVDDGTEAAITELQNSRGAGALDGDLLGDTPEDPGPAYWIDHGFGTCDANRASVQVNGVTYRPDRRNVMSYFGCNGGDRISTGQANMVKASLRHASRSLLTRAPCGSDFHNLAADRFQTCFDYWVNRGLWPQALTVSEDAQRISGSFQSGPFRGEVHHLMGAGAYDQVTARADAGNWTPKSLSVTRGRYTALWEPSGGSDVVTVRDTSEASFNSLWQSLYGQGYTQTDWYLYNDGSLKMSASWTRKPSFNGFGSYYGLTIADFNEKNRTFIGQGLRVDHFVGYRDGGTVRYAAIWTPGSANRQVTVSSSGADYQTTYNQMTGNRCRLHKVNAHDADSFAAVWTCP
jgi:hypothetical protein